MRAKVKRRTIRRGSFRCLTVPAIHAASHILDPVGTGHEPADLGLPRGAPRHEHYEALHPPATGHREVSYREGVATNWAQYHMEEVPSECGSAVNYRRLYGAPGVIRTPDLLVRSPTSGSEFPENATPERRQK